MIKQEKKLKLIEQGDFLGTSCDFYKDKNNQIYMTREQIGEALEYQNPRDGVFRIHKRNEDRLNKFSTVVKLSTVEGSREVARDRVLYAARGIYDICRFSRQPVADDFYDWVYDKIEILRQTSGVVQIGQESEFLDNYFPTLSEDTKLILLKDLNESAKKLQEKVLELQPMADDWSAYSDAKGNITVANLAKSLNISGIGRNKMFGILRENKVLRDNNEPYQRFVNGGYFEVLTGIKNGFKYTQTVVTGKGMSYVNKKMKEWGYA